MKLNQREKFLLLFLGFALLMAGSYYYLLAPQVQRVANLKAQQAALELEVQRVETLIASYEGLKKEYDGLLEDVQARASYFFPILVHERILVLLEDMEDITNMPLSSVSYGTIGPPNLAGTTQALPSIQQMTLSFPVSGSFDQFMNYVRAWESLERSIIIDNLSLSGEATVQGSMSVSLYAVGKPFLQPEDEDYLSWPYTREYGKDNPFVR